MNYISFLFACILLLPNRSYSQNKIKNEPKVETGIEVLRNEHFKQLSGKRIGLITNATGVDHNLESTIDILYHAKNVHLVALFGPEHGIRGAQSAGSNVKSSMDPVTHLPVYSLYGKTNKPSPKMLKGLDALVYDIQDIGVRSYTYISTLGLAMEAAADNGLDFYVLDRPDPLGGDKVEGNIVHKGYISFVSEYPIPYVYGLTTGELARLLNNEGMLPDGKKCNLKVIQMKGWHRVMTFNDTGLPWVPTSPHIPHKDTPMYYVSTGIMGELGVISEGVGYTLPFQMMGATWMNGIQVSKKMNELHLPGVMFRPVTFKAYYGIHKGQTLSGVQVYITNYKKANLMSLQFYLMQVNHELYPDKNPFNMASESRVKMFDKVMGTNKIRLMFTKNFRYSDIRTYLNKDVASFRKLAQKYYLYK
ncbi:MAG TPA: DUF1343 domain-containing protein [Balneolales bacterium]|nr:DUF1343 domain-containing protein [Balneolales bacterium]